ncbi:L2 [Canis familiaris papillomavirus 7]|uniref:Minor capsid protein L2 n=1 Tax=Canis familiaris papillomavirus 7 TaxID=2759772 RepID=C8YJK3_9PAPI|nr:L2 [Canis familiaris papillomavirus 7]
MLPRLKRQKRASPDQLYAHCRQGGDCIPDVVNKYEHKTPADRILQVGASVIYLGGLNIGTGKGTGGSTGYRPVGVDVNAGASRPVIPRPTIPTETVGVVDLGAGTVTSGDSSIVPLVEATGGGEPIEVTPEVGTGEDLVIHPASGAPSVTAEGDGQGVAILEVGTTPSSTSRVTSTSVHSNPSFTAVFHSTPTPGEASTQESIIVSHSGSGPVVNIFEEIPLEPLGRAEFEISDPTPRTSTPAGRATALLSKARAFYNRRFTQIQVTDPVFLRNPASLVQFENPAFEPDDTIVFPATSGEPLAAPNPDFSDIRVLNRAVHGSNPQGGLRVSRLGTRNTLRLRSGTHIGGSSHYYFDISSIRPEIELSVLGEHSGEAEIVLSSGSSGIIEGSNFEGTLSLPDEELLLDEYTEDFSHGQLVISGSGRGQSRTIEFPEYAREVQKGPAIIDDLSKSIHVAHPGSDTAVTSTSPPQSPPHSSNASDTTSDFISVTFDLHPSLRRKRKKRKRRYI